MATAIANTTAPFGAITTYRMVNIVEQALMALATWNTARITRKTLGRLSDHQLRDIGLTRADF